MTEYKDKLNNFGERYKKANTVSTIQEVRPINEKFPKNEDETQLNIWIPKNLMKKLKRYSIDQDKTIKDSVIEAISKHIEF
jgi:hypothetical protein